MLREIQHERVVNSINVLLQMIQEGEGSVGNVGV